jgi:MEDS: MEthanogen/methylotroph, DcmR Sensory domain
VVSATNPAYQPVGFLDRLEGNNHLVMLYDDEKNADLMIARYFQNGLDKGGSCIFLTDGDPKSVERRLASQGIDVEGYLRENRLRIFDTRSMAIGEGDVLGAQKAITAECTRGMRPPFRFAGRTIPDIESVDGMLQGMQFEKTGQEHWLEFGISLLCFYDVRKLESSRRGEWVSGLLENHNQVIYASNPDKAVGFETSLLEEED